MHEPPGDTQEARRRARLRRGHAAPARATRSSSGRAPRRRRAAFDWELLFDPDDRDGEARVRAQYWRANIFGSERYVITPPGSVEHRMRPSEATAANLALAGDWTRNGICGGCVEAAVTSGKLAAQHLSGSPAVVPGTEGWLESD